MKAVTPIRILTAVAAIGLAAACEQTPLSVEDQPTFAALTVPSAAIKKIIVCKDGPAGHDYSFTAVGSTTTDLTLYGGGAFTLQADQCVDAATTVDGAGLSVVFTEATPPAGTLFKEVKVFNLGGTEIYSSTSDPTTPSVAFGRDNGAVVVYYNMAAPSTGCTLTQGYWKTHSEFGPAPYDATWALLGASGASTPFFLSGQTWYEVFNTPVAGNAYYILAHQYMAAVLNGLAGASTAAVTTELASAATLLGTYTPAQIAALESKDAVVKQFKSLGETLDNYNTGLIGPGHCN